MNISKFAKNKTNHESIHVDEIWLFKHEKEVLQVTGLQLAYQRVHLKKAFSKVFFTSSHLLEHKVTKDDTREI